MSPAVWLERDRHRKARVRRTLAYYEQQWREDNQEAADAFMHDYQLVRVFTDTGDQLVSTQED